MIRALNSSTSESHSVRCYAIASLISSRRNCLRPSRLNSLNLPAEPALKAGLAPRRYIAARVRHGSGTALVVPAGEVSDPAR